MRFLSGFAFCLVSVIGFSVWRANLRSTPTTQTPLSVMSLCFWDAFDAKHYSKTITEREYFGYLFAHLRGTRHNGESLDNPAATRSIRSLDIFTRSFREFALGDDYQPLKDTMIYEKLFEDCASGNTEKTRVGLNELRYQRVQPDPIQPLAVLAAQRGYSDILKLCLDQGAVFDAHLDKAAYIGSKTAAMLNLLWNVNWRDIQQHNSRVIRELLSRSIYEEVGLMKWLINHGGEPTLGMFKRAAWGNVSVPVMEILVENFGIQPLEHTGSLQMAASRGFRDLVEFLLGAGANVNEIPPPLDPREPGPYTALYEAVHNGHVDIVRVLLEHGADVDMPSGTFSGMSVLQIAREEGETEILSLLLEKSKGVIPKELKV